MSTSACSADVSSADTDVTVTVDPVAETPHLSATATHGGEGGLIDVSISASGYDLDDNVSIAITGVPAGATLSAGSYNAGTDTWTLTTGQLVGLKLDATNLQQGAVSLHVDRKTVV